MVNNRFFHGVGQRLQPFLILGVSLIRRPVGEHQREVVYQVVLAVSVEIMVAAAGGNGIQRRVLGIGNHVIDNTLQPGQCFRQLAEVAYCKIRVLAIG